MFTKKSSLVLKYTAFAALAIVVNLLTQKIALYLYTEVYSLYLALFLGTGAGLLVKYFLDKYYIFYYQTKNFQQDFRKFILYSIMGIVTTLIFWGSELLFNNLIYTNWAKYLGGALGLVLGYFVKYQLDKRFVFKHQHG